MPRRFPSDTSRERISEHRADERGSPTERAAHEVAEDHATGDRKGQRGKSNRRRRGEDDEEQYGDGKAIPSALQSLDSRGRASQVEPAESVRNYGEQHDHRGERRDPQQNHASRSSLLIRRHRFRIERSRHEFLFHTCRHVAFSSVGDLHSIWNVRFRARAADYGRWHSTRRIVIGYSRLSTVMLPLSTSFDVRCS